MSEATKTGPSAALLSELDEANARLEVAPAGQAISWALDRFAGSIALACSFQDIVIVDLVHAESARACEASLASLEAAGDGWSLAKLTIGIAAVRELVAAAR